MRPTELQLQLWEVVVLVSDVDHHLFGEPEADPRRRAHVALGVQCRAAPQVERLQELVVDADLEQVCVQCARVVPMESIFLGRGARTSGTYREALGTNVGRK